MTQWATDAWPEAGEWEARAKRLGPLRYSDLGRRSLPRPEPAESPGLAAWLVDAADGWWAGAGEPDPFTLAVVSGDDGSLARSVLGLGPRCLAALRYVVVDPDGAGRSEPPPGVVERLSLEEPAFLYPARSAPLEPDDDFDPDDRPPPAQGIGPLVTYLTDLPVAPEGGPALAVVALRWLSRLPYDVVEWPADGSPAEEVRLVPGGPNPGGSHPGGPGRFSFDEVTVALADELVGERAGRPGTRRLVHTGAVEWLRRALASPRPGVLAVVDDETLDFEQLYRVRRPLSEAVALPGTGLAAATWRVG